MAKASGAALAPDTDRLAAPASSDVFAGSLRHVREEIRELTCCSHARKALPFYRRDPWEFAIHSARRHDRGGLEPPPDDEPARRQNPRWLAPPGICDSLCARIGKHGSGLQVGVRILELKQRLVLENERVLLPVVDDLGLRHSMFRLLSPKDRARRVEADHLSLAKIPIRGGNRTWHVRKAWVVIDV